MKGGVVEEKGWLRDVLRESAERVERLPGWIVGARGEWANKPLRDVLANYRRQEQENTSAHADQMADGDIG
jgi:hypothetical protein